MDEYRAAVKKVDLRVHGELKGGQCTVCPRKFNLWRDLNLHIQKIHSRAEWVRFRTKAHPDFPYRCPDCHFIFTKKKWHACEKYQRILTGKEEVSEEEEENQIHSVCPFCDYSGKQYDVSYDFDTLLEHIEDDHPENLVSINHFATLFNIFR